MTNEIAVPQRQVSRFRWWIHLILIAGYFAAAIPFTLWQASRRPALFANPRGLLIACAFEITHGMFDATSFALLPIALEDFQRAP